MDKEVKILEKKAKQLAGKKVKITRRKIPGAFLEGLHFSPHIFVARLEATKHCVLFLKKPSGMVLTMDIKDKYFVVEDIEEKT